MEALQTTLNFRGDTGPYRKLLPDKDLCNSGTQQDNSNYVDLDDFLDMKAEGTKTVKVTFTGEGNQLAIFKCNSDTPASGENNPGDHEDAANLTEIRNNNDKNSGRVKAEKCVAGDLTFETVSEVPKNEDDFRDSSDSFVDKQDAIKEFKTEDVPQNYHSKNASFESEELQYTDMYLNSKSEPEDGISVVLSDSYAPSYTEDESHYITTHEIQLSELDHDVDYEFGRGSCWDFEDNSLVYSFVDYASFDSDETIEGGQVLKDSCLVKMTSNQAQSNDNNGVPCVQSGAPVSTKHENDVCNLNKCASSDEMLSKNQSVSENSAGQIHLSIKTTSRAINESRKVPEKHNFRYCVKHEGDTNGYVVGSPDTKAETVCDRANCFIPAPGRLHFGGKLKGKDITEYSSGASSSVSELDDADKEVRNLTARAFRSLACPYFDAINFSTSSESSASEHGLGLNRWSAFVDLKYGNMKQGREQSLVAHKSSTSTFEMNKNADDKGLARAIINEPQTNLLTLNSSLSDPQKASSSTKKIELKGKFGQGQSGVITLTETLNFRCNVQAGVPESERRAKFAEDSTGSRSMDEVTGTLPSEPGNEGIHQPYDTGETMEDTHKKSVFASSLLKNVISKKMQFEQERKMERGEICDTYPAPSPCFPKEHDTHRERATAGDSTGLQRQNSKFSEASSGFTPISLDELGDIIDSNSCQLKDDGQKVECLTLSPENNLESTNEEGFDARKGESEATLSTLPRSQNSAFRSWREDELELQKENKNYKTAEMKPPSATDNLGKTHIDLKAGSNKQTKMSQLFVPSFQLLSKERELGKILPNFKNSTRVTADLGEGGDGVLRVDNTVHATNPARSAITSKSPEIKISLRSVKEKKHNPFNIANLLTPNIVCSGANTAKAADETKCQALSASYKGESTEKVPHFMVRDVRDNKCKFQTPIHQVRDVRKLVKSSYHFVSLDNKPVAAPDSHVEHKHLKQGPERDAASLSPMVIKCQSVKTKSLAKQFGNSIELSKRRVAEDTMETDRSSPQTPAEGAKNGTIPVHRTQGRVPAATARQIKSEQSEMLVGLKREKSVETVEKKPESNMANQVALEKLRAAVKTMEQLYVFDRNEWKRKTKAPRPITDSHVLSLITSEEQGGTGRTDPEEELGNHVSSTAAGSQKFFRTNSQIANRSPPTFPVTSTSELSLRKEETEVPKTIPSNQEEKHSSKTHQRGGVSNKSMFSFGNNQRTSANSSGTNCKAPQHLSVGSSSTKSLAFQSPKGPLSLKICPPKHPVDERQSVSGCRAEKQFPSKPNTSVPTDSENYLTIPVKGQAREANLEATSNREQSAIYTVTSTSAKTQAPGQGVQRHGHSRRSPKRSPVIVDTRSPDTPTATIYHHSLPMAMQGTSPQVLCFSPSAPSGDHIQPTQRRMLLDPTTGHYYLVDTPVQPAIRRLFDPETGQYVEVPMPQQPATPVPVPVPQLGSYAPTYMLYPGFVPSTATLSGTPLQSKISVSSEAGSAGEKAAGREATPLGDTACSESPYYSPTGRGPQVPPVPHFVTTREPRGSSDRKPVISITSQQGPRIIAPPSFDGTTMSFVVEHR